MAWSWMPWSRCRSPSSSRSSGHSRKGVPRHSASARSRRAWAASVSPEASSARPRVTTSAKSVVSSWSRCTASAYPRVPAYDVAPRRPRWAVGLERGTQTDHMGLQRLARRAWRGPLPELCNQTIDAHRIGEGDHQRAQETALLCPRDVEQRSARLTELERAQHAAPHRPTVGPGYLIGQPDDPAGLVRQVAVGWVVELAGIEPASCGAVPGLLRVQFVLSLFSAPALPRTGRRRAQSGFSPDQPS